MKEKNAAHNDVLKEMKPVQNEDLPVSGRATATLTMTVLTLTGVLKEEKAIQ